ncbi:MAG: type II toxin-antitoxin system HicA family toxin [Candidatus Kapabacteria bacterium]|nr:type II toxin-antitoxin system HicA family toxin [Candidatus Kapabacteria bacterium]
MKIRDIIKLLEQDGWYFDRQKGSHRQFWHPTKSGTVTVAGKESKDLQKSIEQSILTQAGLK